MKGDHLGEFEELVLLTIAVLFDDAYGIAIQHELKERCGRSVTISTVHAALYRLKKKGFVDSRYGDVTPERGGKRKLLFKVTQAGEGVLARSKEMRNNLWNAIPNPAFGQ